MKEFYNLCRDELRELIDAYCPDGDYKKDIDYTEGFDIPVERHDRDRTHSVTNDAIVIAYDGDEALVADLDLVESLICQPTS